MDEEKKLSLRIKFSEIEKLSKDKFSDLVAELINNAKRKVDRKKLN